MNILNSKNNTDYIIVQFEGIFREKFLNIKNNKLFYFKFVILSFIMKSPKSYRNLLSAINENISSTIDKEELKLIIKNLININTSMHNFNLTSWGFIAAILFWGFSIIIDNASNQFNGILIYSTIFMLLILLLVFTIYCEYKLRKKCYYELVFELLSSRDK